MHHPQRGFSLLNVKVHAINKWYIRHVSFTVIRDEVKCFGGFFSGRLIVVTAR